LFKDLLISDTPCHCKSEDKIAKSERAGGGNYKTADQYGGYIVGNDDKTKRN